MTLTKPLPRRTTIMKEDAPLAVEESYNPLPWWYRKMLTARSHGSGRGISGGVLTSLSDHAIPPSIRCGKGPSRGVALVRRACLPQLSLLESTKLFFQQEGYQLRHFLVGS